ncbi:MAG TPA: NAD(P)H-dependent oxidoreductase subunit E [Candidatus Methylomirabilis sp.]|nr:NAD(P)H-dependent oxidoreductase subunit E [Candidatus Methylomirabilis sp.]
MVNGLVEAPQDPLVVPAQRLVIDRIIEAGRQTPGAAMVVLNELQSQVGYVSFPMQEYVARRLRVPRSQIYGVISFYSFFTTKPRGKHTIKLCLGTACYVGGVTKLIQKAKQLLGVQVGETTGDWRITLETCRCVGACSQAPTVTVDGNVYGRVKPEQLPEILARYP